MYKGNYEVEVLINGSPAREYSHEGKVFIEGRQETAYKIKVRNNGRNRVKAVISVDGINVISGEEATLLGRGYIINGYNSLIVDGWRKDHGNVHEFYFSDKNQSYSVKSGKGRKNIGVIGVSIVEEENYNSYTYLYNTSAGEIEKQRNPWFVTSGANTYSSSEYNKTDCSTMYCSSNDSIGTGWGKEIRSSVTDVSFNSKGYPAETFEIFYDTKNGLRKKGICFDHRPCYIDGPNAFPGSFCTPPNKY